MSFEEIRYKGKAVAPDIDNTTQTVYYKHIYRTNYDGTLRQHKCLEWGRWCWKNAVEDIPEAIKFLFRERTHNRGDKK